VIVQCVFPDESHVHLGLGDPPINGWLQHLRLGSQYLVLGVTLEPVRPEGDLRLVFEIEDSDGHVLGVPAGLFEIIDGSVSRHWVARAWPDGGLTLWPDAFYSENFHDRLSSGVPEAALQYAELRRRLESEFSVGE
jgi:hypothetical protein